MVNRGQLSAKALIFTPGGQPGPFFSGSGLSDDLVATFTKPIDENSLILDPACGSGDLLLACSRRLPLAGSLPETVEAWGRQLFGLDLYPEFIRAARARLVLAAALRGPMECKPEYGRHRVFVPWDQSRRRISDS